MLEIREALLHPMLVHFPIVLFILALGLKVVELFVMSSVLPLIQRWVLGLGAMTYLLSLFLGDIAFDAIRSDFCHLTSVYRHEDLAHQAAYFFVSAIFFEALTAVSFIKSNKIFSRSVQFLVFLMLLVGNGYMLRTAHLGAELVYEKGAAVRGYPHDCDQ